MSFIKPADYLHFFKLYVTELHHQHHHQPHEQQLVTSPPQSNNTNDMVLAGVAGNQNRVTPQSYPGPESEAENHSTEMMEDEYTEGEEEELDFDDDIPIHRRMTVSRVQDHAELADSVLSAQSAPTINLTPISSLHRDHPSGVPPPQPPLIKIGAHHTRIESHEFCFRAVFLPFKFLFLIPDIMETFGVFTRRNKLVLLGCVIFSFWRIQGGFREESTRFKGSIFFPM